MGFLSNVHRYREAGEEANANNVERFGMPVKSLFTSTKLLSLHHHIDITDANENIVYQSESRILSLRDRTDVTDRRGELVAHVERKILSLHERHYVTMADGREFELSNGKGRMISRGIMSGITGKRHYRPDQPENALSPR